MQSDDDMSEDEGMRDTAGNTSGQKTNNLGLSETVKFGGKSST
jgi:hypothetical protein